MVHASPCEAAGGQARRGKRADNGWHDPPARRRNSSGGHAPSSSRTSSSAQFADARVLKSVIVIFVWRRGAWACGGGGERRRVRTLVEKNERGVLCFSVCTTSVLSPPHFMPALKYDGSFPSAHLMLHPIEFFMGFCTGRPASTSSSAARRSAPVGSIPLPGRASSN